MRAIFISYRRDDAEGQAGRLFNDLIQHFGDDAVFMDVAAIEPGRDFRRAIDQQVASCGVLLALIGKRWVTASDEPGTRRLDDPMDFVRLETASALKRDIPVVPVLVQGARMPRVEDLPEDLKELAFRNGVELTHARWDSDVQLLVKALRPHVGVKQAPPSSPGSSPPRSVPRERSSSGVFPSRAIFTGLFGVLLLACGWYVWQRKAPKEPAHQADIAQRTRDAQTPEELQHEPEANINRQNPIRPSPGRSIGKAQAATAPKEVQHEPKADISHEMPVEPSPTYGSLIGSWLGSPSCTVVFLKDNGKNVEGNCDAVTVLHKISGVYVAEELIEITITRIDEDQCATKVSGYVEIKDSHTIEFVQDGWDGCGVKTGPAKTRLHRS